LSNVAAVLEGRAVLEISGVDAKALLQGLMTNDMGLLDEDGGIPSISAAFLNPKGRVLADALVTRSPRHEAKGKPGYLVDCPLSVADSLKTHLKLYKLRSKVRIKDATALYDVLVSGVLDPWQAPERERGGDVSPAAAGRLDDGAGGSREVRFPDPRSPALGVRLIRSKGENGSDGADWPDGDPVVPEGRYHALRMANGVGEGSELLDSIPLESNLDLLGSISFTKGCYVGQELTARTQFKGFVRKRVLPVLFPEGAQTSFDPSAASNEVESQGLLLSRWDGVAAPPEAGSKVVDRAAEDGRLGALVSVSPAEYNVGLALLRLGKVLSPASGGTDASKTGNTGSAGGQEDSHAHPALDCRVVDASSQGEEEQRRCSPLIPPWWPVDLDPTTGKVPV
ncbi:unnamed protein product, partial [Ectocarpus sp. 13 AM-2016]